MERKKLKKKKKGEEGRDPSSSLELGEERGNGIRLRRHTSSCKLTKKSPWFSEGEHEREEGETDEGIGVVILV